MEKLIGRACEKEMLMKTLGSPEAELIAVYGRRRVGKTFLIRSVFEKQLLFELSGIHEAKLKEQLQNFSFALKNAMGGKSTKIDPSSPDDFKHKLTWRMEVKPAGFSNIPLLMATV